MKVEKAISEAPVDIDEKKKWSVVLAILSVAVVVVLITIIIVVAVRSNEPAPEPEEEVVWYDETEELYDDYSQKIANAIIDADAAGDGAAVKKIYKRYIEGVEDPIVKAKLKVDYYIVAMSYDYKMEKQYEVMTALAELDEELKTIESAAALYDAAYYYGDNDLMEEYKELMETRINEDAE